MKARLISILFAMALLPSLAAAQRVELAILGGGHIPISPSINVSTGFAIQGNGAVRIAGVPFVGLYLEVPVIATFGIDAGSACVTDLVCKYNSLFVTPGLKLKLAPSFPISPYFLVGGGVVRFHTTLRDGTESNDTNGVFDVGGGLDLKIAPFVSLRGELRDMYAGTPRLSLAAIAGRQHNLIAEAGLVVRF